MDNPRLYLPEFWVRMEWRAGGFGRAVAACVGSVYRKLTLAGEGVGRW